MNFDALSDLDLGDRKTQIMLAGAAIVAGLVLAKLRGGPNGDEGDARGQFVIEYNAEPGGPAYNGTFPPAPPIFVPNPAPNQPDPDPNPDPDGWSWVDPTGKPYSCPIGSRMAMEKGGTGNHVCVNLATGQAFPVTLDSTGKPWTPADDPAPIPTPGGQVPGASGKPYYCDAPSVLAFESSGSGNHVCRWPDGRETRVKMRASGGQGIGGDAPARGNVIGLPSVGGFSPLPAPITARRTYTVLPGDSLASIASRVLAAPQRWPALVERNPQLRGVQSLEAGMVLDLP